MELFFSDSPVTGYAIAPRLVAARDGDLMGESGPTPLQRLLVSGYDDLKARLRHRLGSEALASEILHETYLRLHRLNAAEPVQSPKAYLLRIALNLAATGRKADHRRLTRSEVEVLCYGSAYAADPAEIAEARSEIEALQRAVNDLPARRRAILIASRIEEASHHDIARRFRISTRTVEKELKLALIHCGERLDRKVVQRFGPRPP
jgi:RNA polymerase sigma factor (sigma-70 family)